MDLKDKCPISKQIDNMDETIKELNDRIGELKLIHQKPILTNFQFQQVLRKS